MSSVKIGKVKFNITETLGKGSYGVVYKTSNNKALKIMDSPGNEDGVISLRELDILGKLRHPNLSKSLKTISEYKSASGTRYGVLMDMAQRDLYVAMLDDKFSLDSRLKSLFEATNGLDYLHQNRYLHLDIKPSNILVFKNKTELSDFGLALLTENGEKYYPKPLVSVDHRAPEILNGGRIYDSKVDIWALGITFLSVLSGGQTLFPGFRLKDYTEERVKGVYKLKLYGNKINSTLNRMLKSLPEPTKSEAKSLIRRMLYLNPNKRPTTQEIISSPLFVKFNQKYGSVINPHIYPPKQCDFINYLGFDQLIRTLTHLPVRLETFFLASDIYNRSLVFASKENRYNNLIYLANVAIYMAIKMIENFSVPPQKLVKMLGDRDSFTERSILRGESKLVTEWNGIIYPKNLFNVSDTFRRLEFAFKLGFNCNIYSKIDLDSWYSENNKELKQEPKYNKYTSFNEFLGRTEYYSLIETEPDYLDQMYQQINKIN